YNREMDQNNPNSNNDDTVEQAPRYTNPHDRFCRLTACNPAYAKDFLQSYGDPVLDKFIDLNNLQEAPTTLITDKLKELRMDYALTTRLLGSQTMSEVLFHIEHKSQPGRGAAIQLLTEAALSLHGRWARSGRPVSGNVALPIPVMIIIYNGRERWNDEMWFQDLYTDLPEELRRFVPQFQLMVINLRRFKYGNLPGKPETQAIVESLMRTTDGTLVDHLVDVFRRVAESRLNESMRLSLGASMSTYFDMSTDVTEVQLIDAVNATFTGKERIIMAETIKNSFVLEGIEIGEARAEAKGKPKWKAEGKVETEINNILKLLRHRFSPVPDEIVNNVSGRTDLIALESLFELALQCKSLDDFADGLK
ncbi:MAG: Rpn family recombination-promoting nuclease/putative transposase, partial [Planctomycetaceae bacterium]|nr:Rpn family recombination-promoting nuclease/putative transposase [Planctomycetaceae bacterium]